MKFLLIEYEPRYLDRIRGFLLTQPDVELVAARDGEEGLEAYRRVRPDLVLVSSVLPKMRTPDVIKGMQAMGPTPPILLMMSGYKGRNKRSDAQRVGATSILEKPFTEEVFQAEVAMALGLRPVLDMSPPSGASDPGAPLLSAYDIFSDVLTGLGEGGSNDTVPSQMVTTGMPPPRSSSATNPAFPAPPAKRVSSPAADPVLQKRLEDTLSGLMPPPRKPVSGPFPAADEPLRPVPTERTARINVEQALGALAQSAASGSARPADPAANASVDKLLKDTLSGLMPIAKTVRPAAREVSGETLRLKTPPLEPPAPRPASAVPAPAATAAALTPSAPPRVAAPAAPPRRVTPAPGQFGRYQLLEKIGSGGMAEVFKARMRGEEGFEKIVAIKRIVPHMAANDAFITMFIDEAKLAAQLNHNNITHIFDLGKVDAWHYIAMEFVEGKDLRTLLKLGKERSYPLPPELALFVAAKIANALDYAHRRPAADGTELNLVHRDVSPQNILISYEGDIKLCDFGIAKAASKVSTTISGALKGKLQYMSPEQAWGKRVDRRSDVFSLGAVLHEMLTGAPLFEGDTDMSVLERVREGEVEAPSARGVEVSKRVDQIVLKALAKNPQERYQNASEMEKDLHAVLYAFQPSPGPADVAIYLHRLLEAPESSPTGDEIDAAFDKARDSVPAPAAAPVLQKKGRGLLIHQTGEMQIPYTPPAPAPRESAAVPRREAPRAAAEAAASIPAAGESKGSRTGLVAGIGLAAAALVGVALFMTKDRWSGPKAAPPAPAPKTEVSAPAPETASAPAPAPAAEGPRVVDPKAVEAEARRLAAEREKAATAAKAASAKTGAAPAPAVLTLQPKTVAEAPKEAAVKAPEPLPVAAPPVVAPPVVAAAPKQEPAAAAPVPTEVSAPEKAPVIPAATTAPVKEGELVGPGEGVVEPRLVRLGPMSGLPMQARQVKRTPDGSIGTPVIMALVDERGVVVETRLIRPSSYKFADDAAARALKGATIEPATKDGVKVKMWKTFPIAVRP
ncbi:MAG: protein kinase [Acidobacteria bacterium]|nr:protein kinase [Acidobacteriota bacterium]